MVFVQACDLNVNLKLKKKILFLAMIRALEFSVNMLKEDRKSLNFDFLQYNLELPLHLRKKCLTMKCKVF